MATSAGVAETVERVFKPIQQFTRGWMMAKATDEHGVALGMRTGREFWVVGRAGVIGEAPAEVAVAALAFHAPEHVIEAWEHVPAGLTHFQVSEHYQGQIHRWGDEVISPFDPERMERLDALGRRIIDAAPACLGALFTGWRRMPIPASVGARVALTTHILREMRAAAHINAIVASGITPLDAILASTNAPPRTGPGYAEQMGFKGPFRDPEEVRPQRLAAERLTAAILEPYFAVLSGEELADFGELVETTRNAIDM
ncbi:MAG: hypothetical protein R2749_06915 [Acidimicrobiales bacterium]